MNLQSNSDNKQYFFLLLFLILGCSRVSYAEPIEDSTITMSDYCLEIREQRQQQINNNVQIEINIPLRNDGTANCFTPAENLFYISLVEAQKILVDDINWFSNISADLKEKAQLACNVMGYNGNFYSQSLQECEREQYNRLMSLSQEKFERESKMFIRNRNQKGEELVKQCISAFHKSLPSLPNRMRFPLAYYDVRVSSFPDWYIQKKFDNDMLLEGLNSVYTSSVLKTALEPACPGDMAFWLYR